MEEFATEKQNTLAEAQRAFDEATRNLETKMADRSVTVDDMIAVQKAAEALRAAEALQVCFECEQGCAKPKEWTQLYRDLEGENAHLRAREGERQEVILELTATIADLKSQVNLATHNYEGALIDLANAQAREEQLSSINTELETELVSAQGNAESASELCAQAQAENAELTAELDLAGKQLEALSVANALQRQEFEEARSALSAANQSLAEAELRLATANALSDQRREFAEKARRANETFSIQNQELKKQLEDFKKQPIINDSLKTV